MQGKNKNTYSGTCDNLHTKNDVEKMKKKSKKVKKEAGPQGRDPSRSS